MSENPTDSLLEELKNLNTDLKQELKKTEVDNSRPLVTNTTSVSGVSGVSGVSAVSTQFVLTDDNLNDFILENAQKIIVDGVKTIKDLQSVVAITFDSKLITGYSELVKATTSSLDTLNKLNVERAKMKNAKEVKQMDIEAKKQLPEGKGTQNTVNLICTREEIFKMINGESEKSEKPAIDAEVTEIKDPQNDK